MRSGFVSALLGSALVGSAIARPNPRYGKWMGGGNCPWENRTETGSHPQGDMPDTGETRYYDFSIARGTFAPDGVQRDMIVVNGQFPGPTIEANWGDWIEVNVHNNIYGPEDLTSIHWHGLNQPGTGYFDGVVTVSQCPIVPGGNLTYRFRADEYGTSWYHSHYSAQYSSGIVGPIIVHGPSDPYYDADLGPIMVSDWFHDDYEDIVGLVLAPTDGLPYRPFSDSNIVGGAGQYPCANVTNGASCSVVPYASYQFEAGKTHRLRFINSGAAAFETISIDGHTLTVIANDFVPVTPYDTEFVTLGVGQRTDVLVKANAAPGNYWLRAFNSHCGDSNGPDGRAIISYSGFDPSVAPTSIGSPTPENPNCANDPLASTVPAYPIAVADAETTITLDIGFGLDDSGVFRWLFNNQSYGGDLDNALLFQAIASPDNFAPQSNVYNTGTNGTVRVIINNLSPAPHPIHLHGHDFQVLAEGVGSWDGTIVNPSNPQRRDVQMLQPGTIPGVPESQPSYIVIQFTQDNPGLWPLHCHIAWHLNAGMVVMILEHPEEVAKIQVPDSVTQTCSAFATWKEANPSVGIDHGGLRKRVADPSKGGHGHSHAKHGAPHRRGVFGLDDFADEEGSSVPLDRREEVSTTEGRVVMNYAKRDEV